MSNRRRVRDTHLRDQLDAAIAEAEQMLARLERRGRPTVATGDPGEWIEQLAIDVLRGIEAGAVRYCAHVNAGPRPLHVAAWRRDVAVCSACISLLLVHGDADFTCDRCGRVDLINGAVSRCGPIILYAGVCLDCSSNPAVFVGSGAR